MKSIQVSARTVQKAIDQALKDLNLSQDEVDIKILDEGGLFRKAKVEIFYEEKESSILEESNYSENKSLSIQEDKLKEEKEFKNLSKDLDEIESLSIEFLSKIFKYMGVETEIDVEKKDSEYYFTATGENAKNVNRIIGRRGETLNSIQEVLKNVVRNKGYKEKVFFTVGDYKNKRENSLIALAQRTARKAVKIGKPIKLESMCAYDRKIIHTTLQDFEGVTTQSEGQEPHRYLVVIPKK